MKKILALTILLAMLLFALCSCFETDSSSNQENGDQEPEKAEPDTTSKGNLGDYSVVIESSRLATDYWGDPVIIVKYSFTNHSDEAACFAWSLDYEAYQNGVGLNEAYSFEDSVNYSDDNQYKKIKSGTSLSVEVAYKLNDTKTDVEVEVSELYSYSDKKVTKIFSIK